jgi:hypothetical protein
MTKTDTSIFLRATTSFFVAHALASADTTVPIAELYDNKIFLFAMVCLFALTMVFYEIIGRSNAYLDLHYDWIDRPAERLLLQFSLCLCLCGFVMLLVDLVGLTILYGASSVTKSMVLRETVIVACYVLSINLLYFARYLYNRSRETTKVLERDFPQYTNLK